MAESPKRRRWFQFGLRTWFVLIALVAWACATRPYLVERKGDYAGPESGSSGKPIYHIERELNPQLLWPAAALVSLVLWKAGALVIEHRRARAA